MTPKQPENPSNAGSKPAKNKARTQQEFEIPEPPDRSTDMQSHKFILETLREKILAQDPLPHTSELPGLAEGSDAVEASGPQLDLPSEKNYFRVREVAALLGVGAHVLRFWESEFSMVRPTKSRSGQRVYRRKDVKLLARIQHLLHEQKLSIRAARDILLQERRQRLQAETEPAPAPRRQSAKTAAPAKNADARALDLKEILVDLRQIVKFCQQDPFEYQGH